MPHVRHDHLQIGMAARDIVDIDRPPKLGRRIARERRSHMHGERQIVLYTVGVDRLHARIVQVHAVVDRTVLHSAQA